MRFGKLFILVPLIVIFSLQAAPGYQDNQAPDLNSLSDNDLKTVAVRLERKSCYGNCPVYTLTIRGDGTVAYAGERNVEVKETREGRIDAKALRALLSEFASAKFLSLPEDYSEEKCKCQRQCADMPSAITELSVKGVTHRVDHYYGCGCAPKALFDLETAIDNATNAKQWTGDVSKQGPFATTCRG